MLRGHNNLTLPELLLSISQGGEALHHHLPELAALFCQELQKQENHNSFQLPLTQQEHCDPPKQSVKRSPSSLSRAKSQNHCHNLNQQQHQRSLGPQRRRTKRLFHNHSCQHCSTKFTSQWRTGPSGPSSCVHLSPPSRVLLTAPSLLLSFISTKGCAMPVAFDMHAK